MRTTQSRFARAARLAVPRIAARTLAALVLLCACVGVPLERSIETHEWREAQAGPFRVVSDLAEKPLLELAERLLVFDRITRQVTNARDFAPRVPTLVLATARPGTYGRLKPPSNTVGLFVSTTRGNYVLLDASRRDVAPERILYHEYGHFILHNDSAFSYPAWYDEGMAELLSSTRVTPEGIRFGDALRERLRVLLSYGFMPSQKLFSTRSPSELSPVQAQVFYAQAWFTVLYLGHANAQAKEQGLADRKGQVGRYLALYNQGVPVAQAFAQAFEITFEQLDAELQMFFRKGSIPVWTLSRETLGAGQPTPPRLLRPAEAAEALGSAVLAVGSAYGTAERLFGRAVELEPERARALFGLARSRLLSGRGEGVDPLYERARSLDPNDELGQLDYAEYILAKSRALEEAPEAEPLARQAVQLLEQLAQREPRWPEPRYLLAKAYGARGEPPARVRVELEQAYALLPSDLRVAYALARTLAEDGSPREARRIAGRALAGSHDARSAAELEALLASLPTDVAAPTDLAAPAAPSAP